MNTRILAGCVLFLVLVVGFVVFLPEINRLYRTTGNTELPPAGNNRPVPDVVDRIADVTGPSGAETTGAPLVMTASSETIDGRGVSISLLDLSGYQAGDRIAVYIPQEDSHYSGDVTDASTTASGNRVLTGFLRSEGQDYRFVFTAGRHQTFGTIYTPRGGYQLETRNGQGRIVATSTLRESLDFSEPDYVIPERRELPPERNAAPG